MMVLLDSGLACNAPEGDSCNYHHLMGLFIHSFGGFSLCRLSSTSSVAAEDGGGVFSSGVRSRLMFYFITTACFSFWKAHGNSSNRNLIE